MTYRSSLLALIFLAGCACKPTIEYRVAEIPEPPVIVRPALATDALNRGMDPGTVLQLHRETILALKAWGLELEAALNAYRKKP